MINVKAVCFIEVRMMVNLAGSLNRVIPERNSAHFKMVLLFSTAVSGMLMTAEVALLLFQ